MMLKKYFQKQNFIVKKVKIMKNLLVNIICWYQKHISLWITSKNIRCKFYPTCSDYMKEALEKYGVFKGLRLGIWRLIRCNPFSKGGYDPLK